MKKALVLGLAGALSALTNVAPARAQVSVSDVVILRCSTDPKDSSPGRSTVITSESSRNARPTIAIGSGCAQAIADLLNANFSLTNVEIELLSQDSRFGVTQYLFVRNIGGN